MSNARRSSTGCWTCKVRRKGCDLELPNCETCIVLGVACHYGQKPAWMDGGGQQQLMAEQLKKEIKHNALVRRGKSRTRRSRRFNDDPDEMDVSDSSLQPPLREHYADTAFVNEPITPITTPPSLAHSGSSPGQTSVGQWNQAAGAEPITENSSTAATDFETGLLMSYLDYSFPVLFPFYKPSLLEGGRVWLLALALRHPAFYHNILGLAASFLCAVPVQPGLEHDTCAVKAQSELHAQLEKTVQGVQESLRDVTRRGIHHSLAENVRLLGNIVQLVNFEVVFASSSNWQIHSFAAVDLFDQILRHHCGGNQSAPVLTIMLEELRGSVPLNCSILSPEQAALRFFAAMLSYQEIIACTARETTPILMKYYDELFSNESNNSQPDLLDLRNYIGCHNWVMLSIAKIASLNEWKKSAKRAGALDMMDLVRRATSIQDELRAGSARLEAAASVPRPQPPLGPYWPLETILAKSNISPASQSADQSAISRIWAHAAHVYLNTVLSGWQPCNPQLRSHVAQALDLLSTIDNPSWLRTLAWPFCVTGCFATEEQETAFRNVANASGGLAMFGTVRDALAIMERVWSLRSQFEADSWDVAFCLRILGHSVLLV